MITGSFEDKLPSQSLDWCNHLADVTHNSDK